MSEFPELGEDEVAMAGLPSWLVDDERLSWTAVGIAAAVGLYAPLRLSDLVGMRECDPAVIEAALQQLVSARYVRVERVREHGREVVWLHSEDD
ncbi:hypothetical protein [Nocardia brasiliensis]|uniref:hypothetical protein n=1 Tax=Nocardia brasiliensis TaxID=37326 RepID=UPI00245734BC|nr:hypothetical protein [Nocardia brasiliensis]